MNHNSTSDEQTLKASAFIASNSRGRGKRRGYRGSRDGGSKDGNVNFWTNDDYDKSRGRDFDKSNVECYRCHKFGHYRSECCTRLPSEKEEKSIFFENKVGETLLIPVHAESEPEEQVIWYVDTYCSNHMTGIWPWIEAPLFTAL